MDFVTNIISNSMAGFVEAGTRAAGGYAGDALIRAGDMIENAGRNAGNSVERRASGYGAKIAGQGAIKSVPSLPPTQARKALPAPAKKTGHPKATPKTYKPPTKTPGKTIAGNTSKAPIGANKYPGGGDKVASAYTAGKKAPPGKTAATKNLNLPAANVPKLPGAGPTKSLPKPFPEDKPYPTSKRTAVKPQKKNELPKPFPNNTSWPGAEKKAPVKAGPNNNNNKENKPPQDKPYPGSNDYPGQGKKTPVKKYKPAEPYKPPVQPGEEFKHI